MRARARCMRRARALRSSGRPRPGPKTFSRRLGWALAGLGDRCEGISPMRRKRPSAGFLGALGADFRRGSFASMGLRFRDPPSRGTAQDKNRPLPREGACVGSDFHGDCAHPCCHAWMQQTPPEGPPSRRVCFFWAFESSGEFIKVAILLNLRSLSLLRGNQTAFGWRAKL